MAGNRDKARIIFARSFDYLIAQFPKYLITRLRTHSITWPNTRSCTTVNCHS